MPVGVVRADAHQRHPGAGRGEEGRVGVGAAVVRHLEHVGAQVHPAVEHTRLGGGTQVAGEQHPDAARGDPHDQREVVGLGGRRRDLRGRGEDLQAHVAHLPSVSGDQHLAGGAGPDDRGVEGPGPLVGRGQRPGGDGSHLPSLQGAGQSADVVGVEVGQQHQRQPVDPEPVEAAVDRADLRAGVDEHPLAGTGRHHQGVALPDVAGDQDRSGGRPAVGRLAQRPAEQHQADQRRQRERAQPTVAPQRQTGEQQQDGEQQGPARAGRPAGGAVGQAGRGPGHEDQPPRRPARQPHEDVPADRQDRPGESREQAQHRRRRHRGRGDQVGRQRHRADQAGQPRHQRRGGQPGGRGDGHGVGRGPRPAPPLQASRPAGREQHDGRRRRDRQGEAGVAGQSRIQEQQHDHRGRQRRHGRPRAPGGEGEERDRTHGRRAHHAGVGPDEHHEAGQGDQRHPRLDPPAHRPATQRREDAGEDDRDVRSRHRGQVGQPGAPEVLLQHRVEAPGVPHDQPGQQPVGRCVQHPPRRGGQPVAHRAGGPLQPRRLLHRLGRPPRRQPGDDALGGRHGRDRHPRPDDLAGQHPGPVLRRGEQHRPGAQPDRARVVGDGGDRDVEDQPRRTDAPDAPRVAVHLQDHADRPAAGRLGQRGRGTGGTADGGDRGGGGHGGEDGQQDEGAGRSPAGSEQDGGESGGTCQDEQRGGREQRREEGDRPDRGGDRDQAQVQPRPAAVAAGAHTRTRSASSP
ncbi:hypothetical protein SAMN06273567_107117 [Geodermatophilus aquaeductus]|uniref:Uncharacterized protein n=1 Tax=Geodermatophilus aquaeductus TaxID=1564161 RepID=A0A521F758_9ACTN|nr:hypothetical protein SAMN06273567_107117 [Geodermatophilus aquaeductus]